MLSDTKYSLPTFNYFYNFKNPIKNSGMKKFFLLILLILPAFFLHAQDEMLYSRVKISLEGKDIQQLAQTGIDLTEGQFRAGVFLISDLSADEVLKVRQVGFDVEVMIQDVSAFYRERAAAEMGVSIVRNPADEFPVPQNWELGTMGGFYTYQQVLDKLDFMAATWPHLITVRQPINPLTPSNQGNPIWWLKISDNPNEEEDEPKVLYTGLIHAREGIGVQQMIYYMLWLLENYETNETAKLIVDNTQMYFVPVVNPDGYLYNQQISPSGGGMWRKNRRMNFGGTYGVDINRNFGYKWGLNNTGSSNNPSDETYRGTSAFSEPETDNLRQFCEMHDFKIALNYHSYSNLLLYPWGWTDDPCPDDAIFSAHAALMTRDSKYVYGAGSSTIYPTNGGSDDYMYGDTENKNAIFSYTPEVGSSSDGFWPSISRIIPLCQENMIQNVYAALLSGSYGKLSDKAKTIIGQKEFYLPFDLQRLGFGENESWTVSIEPLDEWIVSTEGPKQFGQLEIMEIVQDSFAITLNNSILSGQSFRFLLTLDNGMYVTKDTITKMFGATSYVFQDNCNQLINWTPGSWGLTQSSFISAPSSITDSPFGDYPNNVNSSITLTQAVEIPNTTYAQLSFWAKWDIEAGWDYATVQIKPLGTFTWIPLQGKFTKPGGSNQVQGMPLYDGISNWVKEEIDLSEYAGMSIQLRFNLKSDGYITGDGFYFDDVEIIVLDVETSLESTKSAVSSLKIYPNPASTQISVYSDIPFSAGQKAEVLDAYGKILMEVSCEAGENQINIATDKLKSGIYFIRLSNTTSKVSKFVIK
jgi:carboxypeptidase T